MQRARMTESYARREVLRHFFFSSRRRHTIFDCDWSSDVCSSDLLAFAIAASVEPEILLVDEALAVGDAVFQHRCLRRMQELQERGTTVLFVSHDLAAVRALCARAILLSGGRIIEDGKPADVLNRYQKIIMAREQARSEEHTSELQSQSNLVCRLL